MHTNLSMQIIGIDKFVDANNRIKVYFIDVDNFKKEICQRK